MVGKDAVDRRGARFLEDVAPLLGTEGAPIPVGRTRAVAERRCSVLCLAEKADRSGPVSVCPM